MTSINYQTIADAIADAVSSHTNIASALRQAIGYSIDELAIASGLAPEEISSTEDNAEVDPGYLNRITDALGLPGVDLAATK